MSVLRDARGFTAQSLHYSFNCRANPTNNVVYVEGLVLVDGAKNVWVNVISVKLFGSRFPPNT